MRDRYPAGSTVSVVYDDGSSRNANMRVLEHRADGQSLVLPDGLPRAMAAWEPTSALRAPRKPSKRAREMA